MYSVLQPTLGSSAWESHGAIAADPENDYKNDQRSGAPLLWRQAEGNGLV